MQRWKVACLFLMAGGCGSATPAPDATPNTLEPDPPEGASCAPANLDVGGLSLLQSLSGTNAMILRAGPCGVWFSEFISPSEQHLYATLDATAGATLLAADAYLSGMGRQYSLSASGAFLAYVRRGELLAGDLFVASLDGDTTFVHANIDPSPGRYQFSPGDEVLGFWQSANYGGAAGLFNLARQEHINLGGLQPGGLAGDATHLFLSDASGGLWISDLFGENRVLVADDAVAPLAARNREVVVYLSAVGSTLGGTSGTLWLERPFPSAPVALHDGVPLNNNSYWLAGSRVVHVAHALRAFTPWGGDPLRGDLYRDDELLMSDVDAQLWPVGGGAVVAARYVELAVSARQELYLVPPSGGPIALGPGDATNLGAVVLGVSASNELGVLFVEGAERLLVVELASGGVVLDLGAVTRAKLYQRFAAVLYFAGGDLWRFDLATRAAQLIVPGAGSADAKIIGDDLIAITPEPRSSPEPTRLLVLSTGQVHDLGLDRGWPLASTDSSRFAYVRDGELWVATADGSRSAVLASGVVNAVFGSLADWEDERVAATKIKRVEGSDFTLVFVAAEPEPGIYICDDCGP